MPRIEKPNWVERCYKTIFYSIIATAAMLYVFLNPQYKTGIYNDDAVYVIAARDLLNTSGLFPQIKPDYPLPGLPLLLFPLAKLVDPYWNYLELLSSLVTVLCVYLIGKWTRKWLSPGESLVVVSLFAFNPVVCKYSGVLMSEPYYLTAVLGSFLLLRGFLDEATVPKGLGLGFLLGWASLLRPEGIVVLICVGATVIVARKKNTRVGIVMIPLIFWFFLLVMWSLTRSSGHTEFGRDITSLIKYWPQHFASEARFTFKFARVLFINTVMALQIPPHPISFYVRFAIIVCCLAGLIKGFRGVWRENTNEHAELLAVALFCGIYFLIHLFWHVAIRRYFIPILPFVLVFMTRGFAEISAHVRERRKWMRPVFVFLFFVPYVVSNSYAVFETFVALDPMKSPPLRTLQWLRENTASGTKVFSIIAPNVSLYAKRFATCEVNVNRAEEFQLFLIRNSFGYIVDREVELVAPTVGSTINHNKGWARIRKWIHQYPHRFQPIFSDASERTNIYRVIPDDRFVRAYEKFNEASRHYATGDYEQAYWKVSESQAIDADIGTAANLLGALYLMANDSANAERLFRRAMALDPDFPLPMVNLATVYHRNGKNEKALEYIKKGLEISKSNGEEKAFNQNILKLQRQWDQGNAMLFIDSPSSRVGKESTDRRNGRRRA